MTKPVQLLLSVLFITPLSGLRLSSNPDQYIRLPTLALKPPMGWNSWDCFGMDVTEDQVKATADYMARNLKAAGWEYVVVDMGWYYADGLNTTNFKGMKRPPQHLDKYGRLIPSERKFPSSNHGRGLKPVADYVHSLGLKFGIHIMRGIPWQAVEQKLPIKGSRASAAEIYEPKAQCQWYDGLRGINMTKAGAAEYYQSIVELYTQWGVDFIKADDMEKPYAKEDIAALGAAIVHSGRQIVLGLSAGPISVAEVPHLRTQASMWRISGDMWDDWSFVKRQFRLCRVWQDYVQPGHWPDCDILPLGKLRINGVDDILAKAINKRPEDLTNENSTLTDDEQTSLLTLWYIFRSPLMMGGNVVTYDAATLRRFANREALAVNQSSERNREVRANAAEVIWTAVNPESRSRYVAFFNLDDTAGAITVSWNELGIAGPCSRPVRDLWQNADVGRLEGGLSRTIPAHGAGLYRIDVN